MTDLTPLIQNVTPAMRQLRRDLHAEPEPGFQEFKTAGRVAAILAPLPGMTLRREVAVTGIVATLDAEKPGPCVALRADMDCLPIIEETGAAYTSKRPGFMHACGHDGHTAALVGAALVLAQRREELTGPVKFIFQPAEEGGAGGQRMVDEGALEHPHVVAVFGLHNMPANDLVLGDVALRPGAFMGGSVDFVIEITGRGGHAASPHTAVDPIYVGAQIVNALQAIVSRQQNPIEALVVTIGSFHAGTASNVIPETARLEGTARSLSPESLAQVPDRLRTVVGGIANTFDAKAELIFTPGYPVTVNHARAAAFVTRVAREVVGEKHTHADYPPILGAEDFSFYQLARPGCYYFLGTRPPDKMQVPLCHHPRFDFNDDALPVAIRMHCEIARRFAAGWSEEP